jgi:methylthioribose-1-phosphate isomerase
MESTDPAAVSRAIDQIRTARPTAVNLMWAVDRMRNVIKAGRSGGQSETVKTLLQEAERIYAEDVAMCEAIGRNGNTLIRDGMTILTHCNAGALATAGMGTALAPMFTAHREGKKIKVYADETRPLLQGARLTMWELMQAGIDATLICDSTASFLMSLGKIDCVIVGADRIAANGDVANKIGTHSAALAASHYGVSFYVAAPSSTFDRNTPDGSGIEIERRHPSEVTHFRTTRAAPEGVDVYAPAFDITPAGLITAVISEKGIFEPGLHDESAGTDDGAGA